MNTTSRKIKLDGVYGLFAALLIGTLSVTETRAETDTVYNLNLHGYAWGNEFSSNWQLESNRLSYSNFTMNGPIGRAEAGDIAGNWNTLGLAGQGFQGLKFRLPGESVETTLIGGQVGVTDLLGRRETSNLFGVQAVVPLPNHFRFGAASLATPGAPAGQGSYINTLSLSYAPDIKRNLSLELAQSQHGYGAQLSGWHRSGALNLNAGLRAATSGFSTAGNPLLRTDRSGYWAQAQYKFNKKLGMTLGSQRYDDGYGGKSRYDSFGLQWQPKNAPSIGVFWSADDTTARLQDLLGESPDVRVRTYGAQISHRFRNNSVFLIYNHQNFGFNNAKGTSNGLNNDLINVFLTRPLGRKAMLSFSHLLYKTRNDIVAQQNETSGQASSFEINYLLGASGKSIGLGAQLQNAKARGVSSQSISPLMRFTWPLRRGDYISMAYQARVVTANFRGVRTPDRFYLSYSRRVNLGGMPTRDQLLSPIKRRQLARITGRVFEDSNANGIWDANESGVPNVELTLLTTEKTQTATDGQFAFKNLEPGKQRVGLVMKTLPLELAPLSPIDHDLQTQAGQVANVDFALARTGQVQGIVFEDSNRNNRQDANEAVLQGVVVRVEGYPVISFSDKNGRFTLADLPPRRWKISVDTASLLGDFESVNKAPLEAVVLPNGEVKGLSIGLAPREKPVTQTFVFNDQTPPKHPVKTPFVNRVEAKSNTIRSLPSLANPTAKTTVEHLPIEPPKEKLFQVQVALKLPQWTSELSAPRRASNKMKKAPTNAKMKLNRRTFSSSKKRHK